MIIIQLKMTVKSGYEAEVKRLNEGIFERVNRNEPNYTLQLFADDAFRELLFIEVAANSAAVKLHLEEHGRDPETIQALSGMVEITSRKIYGELTPELEEMFKKRNSEVFKPVGGTFNRTIVPLDV